jgi:Flp pilus assembly protein TadG
MSGRRCLPAGRLRRAVAAFRRGEAGVAAVEFALVLPVMVIMLLGLSEVTLAVNNDRKVTLVSRALADLSSRMANLSSTDVDDIFKAASIIMQPFDASKLRMVVSQMKVTKVGSNFQGSVDWSCARGTGAVVKPAGTYAVPTGFQTDASYYILVETTLPYTPLFGRTITGTITLGDTTPWPIRNTARVTLTGGCPA